MKEYIILIICAFSLMSCTSGDSDPYHTPSETPPVIKTSAPTSHPSPFPTQTLPPTQVKPPEPSPTTKPSAFPEPLIHAESGPLFDTILSIPVGEDGILYRGAGMVDMQPVGPNGIVVTPGGMIVVGDVFGNRLMRYDLEGNRLDDIDLTPLEILNISDMVSTGDWLYILEISFTTLPERYRVNQLSQDGSLITRIDLPLGFHFEDGLFGLAVGYFAESGAQALVDMVEDGKHVYYSLPDSSESLPERLSALPVFGYDLAIENASQGELAMLGVGSQEFESQMTLGGTISLLSARQDGSYFLQREDLVGWDPITTDITVHFVTATGEVTGVVRYPIKDWYFHIWRYLTVGTDGNVYGLITRENSVDVLRLNFYSQLDPIVEGAAAPSIVSVPDQTGTKAADDCSTIQRLDPDSADAKQIVGELINNYKQDKPTEYLAFEQLWSVDLMGGYAVLQGMVTQEQTDIIVAKQTEAGYVMVSWYIAQLPMPGFRHSNIRGFLAAHAPEVPEELIVCLDLSRFITDQ